MSKIIWMSDPHFTQEGLVWGHDPRIRLEAAIDHINSLHADADFCVISGDMVNRGTEADYKALRQCLDRLAVPYFPMVGNHDNRELFRAHLPLPNAAMQEFVQYSIATSDGLFVCLDTQKTGSDAGEFCDLRRSWLKKQLEDQLGKPTYLFMHHPPRPLGLPLQDQDRMQDGDGFLAFISQYEQIGYAFIGHVHRPITGVMGGIPFATMRSILYQAPPPRPQWDWHNVEVCEEAPAMGVITCADGAITLQYEQFCMFECGVAPP